MSLFEELRRRNVFRVAMAYAVVAWLLIEVADTVFPRIGLPEWTVTFVIAALALGFPLAVAISWAYELTPEGLKKSHQVSLDESITRASGRGLDFFIIGVLAVALGYFVWDKFAAGPATRPAVTQQVVEGDGTPQARHAANESSIAVLPFVNLSPDPDQEYFSDGLSEEILNLLAQIKSLKVIGRTSSFAFKGKNEDLRRIAAALDVAYLLEGSVRKSGDQLRISAQLIQATDGSHLWSQSYDRRLDNVFAIQSEIAAAIVGALQLNLSGAESENLTGRGTTSVPAYELYLQARRLMRERTLPAMEAAGELLDEALALDSDYPVALAAAAELRLHLSDALFGSFGRIPGDPAVAEARALVDRALALDPGLAEGHATAGLMHMTRNDFASAEAALVRALELNPGLSEAESWRATVLFFQGRLRDALAARRRQAELDPLNVLHLTNLAHALLLSGEFEEAGAIALRTQRAFPDLPHGHAVQAAGLLSAGRLAEAREAMDRALDLVPATGHLQRNLASLYYTLGDYGRVLEVAGEGNRGLALLALGRTDEALAEGQVHAGRISGTLPATLGWLYVHSRAGRHRAVLDFYLERWGDLPALESEFGYYAFTFELVPLAVAQRVTGDSVGLVMTLGRWEERLAYMREQGFASPDFRFVTACFQALEGNADAAFATLALAIDQGYREPLLGDEPAFAPLADDPAFQAQVARMIDLINAERAKLDMLPL